jgi:acetyl esterase
MMTIKDNHAMDYPSSMDIATRAFVDVTASFYPDDRQGLSVQDMRRHYNALCAHFAQAMPAGVTSSNDTIGAVTIRRFSKSETPKALVIYIHGGGFVVGGLDSHNDICAGICDDTGLDVVAVDYRLAPEHKHPAALEDCLLVTRHLQQESGLPIILAGDSAGGWLAAMVGLAHPDDIAGQVLIYPMLGGALNQGSYLDYAAAPLLSTAQVAMYWETYFDCPLDQTALTPPMALNISSSPKTAMIAAGCDPLMSETPQYADKLRQAGVAVDVVIEDGLPHGYLRARYSVDRARLSFQRITTAISSMVASE